MEDKDLLDRWLSATRNSALSVIIAGRVFGGRYGEAPQQPRLLCVEGANLTICFNTTERLVVTDPSGIRLGEYQQLIVRDASQVTWGWHYYGRSETPENWCEERFKIRDQIIEFERTGPLMPGSEQFVYSADRIVELL